MTLEALTDVDNGNAIDHQSVQAWADSLDSDADFVASVNGAQVDEQSGLRSRPPLGLSRPGQSTSGGPDRAITNRYTDTPARTAAPW